MLDVVGARAVLAMQKRILIKPNLVNSSPPPVTFPVEATRELVSYCERHSGAQIIIAEGTGDPDKTTWDIYGEHGYLSLAKAGRVELVDLNEEELTEATNLDCTVLQSFMMPKILTDCFVISAATLKKHSLAGVTLSMKNMIGIASPKHYQQGGYWRKSAFHSEMQQSIFELNLYRTPDLALIDGSIGLAEHHLGGAHCDPPVNKLIAGFDPVAVDAFGANLLKVPWQHVGHIKMANGILGHAAHASEIYDLDQPSIFPRMTD